MDGAQMSKKAWKASRRHAREAARDTDRAARASAHLPVWRTVALALGWKWPARRWTETWEKRHAKALKVAGKKTAHFIIEQSRQEASRG